MITSVNVSLIAEAIKDNFPEIPFAHIFGSSSGGFVQEGSDIDIAIFNDTDPLIKVRVLEVLSSTIKNIPVDIVNSCHADPLLAHEALAGTLLFVREDQKQNYAAFYTKTLAEYEDRIYWMKKQLEYRGYEVQWGN